MTEENEPIEEFEYTTLVKINPRKSTLPIDTTAEWSKGFSLVNDLIRKLGESEYFEEIVDDTGEKRRVPHVHPQLLPWMQERRRLMEQIWKLSGGEAVAEGKKQAYKNFADMLFQTTQDSEFMDKHKKDFEKIIEEEIVSEANK